MNSRAAMQVGVKFCGNCNPVVDASKILQEIKLCCPQDEFVPWTEAKDALVILCGCQVGCATRPAFAGPTVLVRGRVMEGKEYADLSTLACRVAARVHGQEGEGLQEVE